MDIALTLIAIALAILLIIRFKVDPVISLIISSVFLGLSAGVGLQDTVKEITGGFGEIMGEVGLLIGFWVLIGSLLQATGTFRALVEIIGGTRGGEGVSFSDTPSAMGREFFRAGQAEGEFRAFDPQVMAVSLRAAIDAVATMPDVDHAAYARELVELFDRATRAEES